MKLTNEQQEEIEFERERQLIYNCFGDTKYNICIDELTLDKVISNQPSIYLKLYKNCLCCDGLNQCELIADAVKITHSNMTIRNVLLELAKHDMTEYFRCNHRYIEGIQKIFTCSISKKELFEFFTGS